MERDEVPRARAAGGTDAQKPAAAAPDMRCSNREIADALFALFCERSTAAASEGDA